MSSKAASPAWSMRLFLIPMRGSETGMTPPSPPQACKEAGIHTQTYYRWRKEYGGLKLDQAKRRTGPAAL